MKFILITRQGLFRGNDQLAVHFSSLKGFSFIFLDKDNMFMRAVIFRCNRWQKIKHKIIGKIKCTTDPHQRWLDLIPVEILIKEVLIPIIFWLVLEYFAYDHYRKVLLRYMRFLLLILWGETILFIWGPLQ